MANVKLTGLSFSTCKTCNFVQKFTKKSPNNTCWKCKFSNWCEIYFKKRCFETVKLDLLQIANTPNMGVTTHCVSKICMCWNVRWSISSHGQQIATFGYFFINDIVETTINCRPQMAKRQTLTRHIDKRQPHFNIQDYVFS